LITVLAVIATFLVHKIWWERKYNSDNPKAKKEVAINMRNWKNKECDKYF